MSARVPGLPCAAAALALALGAAPPARAQTLEGAPPPPADAAEPAPADQRARALFYEGLEAFERGDHAASLAALEASYALRSRPVVQLNIAQVYRAAGRIPEAIAAYERYLAAGAGAITRTREAEVRNTIAYLQRDLARMAIGSEPPGAEVRLDGRVVGVTPLREAVVVAAGEHEVELDLRGFVLLRERVRLAPGDRRALHFRLADLSTAATLRVALAPPAPQGARVSIDGIDVGPGPVERRLQAGGHRLEVTARGYEPFRAEVVLSARQSRALAVRLQPQTPLVAQPWFWVATGALVVAGGIAAALVVDRATTESAITIPVPPPPQ